VQVAPEFLVAFYRSGAWSTARKERGGDAASTVEAVSCCFMVIFPQGAGRKMILHLQGIRVILVYVISRVMGGN